MIEYSARMLERLPPDAAFTTRTLIAVLVVVSSLSVGCGDDAAADASTACEALIDPLAEPGDPIDGDDYETFARGFFDEYCVRCHASTNVTRQERNNAPEGFDWDLEPSVREHLSEIREAVGVSNFMPFSAPFPSCDERARLVRWIDADAP